MELLLPIYVIAGYGYPTFLRIADGILRLHTTEVLAKLRPIARFDTLLPDYSCQTRTQKLPNQRDYLITCILVVQQLSDTVSEQGP